MSSRHHAHPLFIRVFIRVFIRALLVAVWVGSPPAALAQATSPPPSLPDLTPDLLMRLAPSVVKVRVGRVWESGFVFGTPRHVVTSYAHVIASSDVEVIGSDQRSHHARVVAWSRSADLVVLKLDEATGAAPLQAATELPWTPAPIAVLYHPREPEWDSAEARAWSAPLVLSGHVARVSPKEIDLDIGLWGRPGDAGAPIVTPDGRVIGIVSRHSSEKLRMLATRVDRAKRLMEIRGRQGEFSRPPTTGCFGGLFVTPFAAKGLVGAGLTSGCHYGLLGAELTEAFFQSGYRPIDNGRFQSTVRYQLQLDAEIRFDLGPNIRVFLGPGVQLNGDAIDTAQFAPSGQLTTSSTGRWRVRPDGVFGISTGNVFARAVVASEWHFDLGLVFGR